MNSVMKPIPAAEARTPDRMESFPSDAPTVRRAISVAVAIYNGGVSDEKTRDQVLSSDLSRAYLSKEGKVYKATSARRKEWFDLGLHKTKTLRILVTLSSSAPLRVPLKQKETSMEGGALALSEDDVVVCVDKSNIKKLSPARSSRASSRF